MQASHQLADVILNLLVQHQRQMPGVDECRQHKSALCFDLHRRKLSQQIASHQLIRFVLPAFPAKSSNSEKTETMLPDLGERLGLRLLNDLAANIHRLYPPGVEMMICSDGRVFNDLVKVSDANVNAYAYGIKQMIRDEGLSYLTVFSLDDYYCNISYADMREKLMKAHGEDLQALKARVKLNEKDKMLFNGIHRFIYEDQLSLMHGLSKNQIRDITKSIAYEVIRRSNAWSRFIDQHFPEAVRLSIHPQVCGSEKFGISLVRANDGWATPWHRVVIADGGAHRLIRRAEAIALGAKPVYQHQMFSHYEV